MCYVVASALDNCTTLYSSQYRLPERLEARPGRFAHKGFRHPSSGGGGKKDETVLYKSPFMSAISYFLELAIFATAHTSYPGMLDDCGVHLRSSTLPRVPSPAAPSR